MLLSMAMTTQVPEPVWASLRESRSKLERKWVRKYERSHVRTNLGRNILGDDGNGWTTGNFTQQVIPHSTICDKTSLDELVMITSKGSSALARSWPSFVWIYNKIPQDWAYWKYRVRESIQVHHGSFSQPGLFMKLHFSPLRKPCTSSTSETRVAYPWECHLLYSASLPGTQHSGFCNTHGHQWLLTPSGQNKHC